MKVYAKAVLVGFLLSAATAVSVLAQEGAEFDKRKTERLSEIDERIAKLQEHRGCVAGAADQTALKGCRDVMGEWRKGEKMEHLDKRKAKLDERKKKLEAKQP